MSIEAKPFQKATIEAALHTLKGRGARRFLVADEVGLGKTVVASGVIESLAHARRKTPLCVLYVCSNLTIARQNMKRLLSFMPAGERDRAIGMIDRPSLLPTQKRPTHPRVQVFQLTPDTAIPTRKGQSRDGRKEERALALVLIRLISPTVSTRELFRAFKRNAGDSFKVWVRQYEEKAAKPNGLGGGKFRNRFRVALREVLEVADGEHLPPRLNEFLQDHRYPDLVGAARTALAIAALRDIKPDLVIFDEFQRFRDLTENVDQNSHSANVNDDAPIRERAATRVMNAIRGDARAGSPALLLLSATPYTPYRSRAERHVRSFEERQSSDFFDLVSFLAADQRVADEAMAQFLKVREELQKGEIRSERAKALRKNLTRMLRPLISRTERTSSRSDMAAAPSKTSFVDEPLHRTDLHVFRGMHDCFDPADRDWIVPLWQSIPLPLQTLGTRYKAWRRMDRSGWKAEFTKQQRNEYRVPAEWPHPRLRALMAATSNPAMALPWSRPSLPWWPLSGGWKDRGLEHDDKLLVFSRYRAVPTALSGLLSYVVERPLVEKLRGAKVDYEALPKHWLQPSGALLELFHPSPLLAALDPLCAPLGDARAMRRDLRRQLEEKLKQLDIRVIRTRKSRRKPWELLAALEKVDGIWDASLAAWSTMSDRAADEAGLLSVALGRWDKAARRGCTEVSMAELDELANLAMEAPGVIFLRSLRRHWNRAADDNLALVVSTVWNGLRNYLNRPWFVSALTSRKGRQYPAALRLAVIDGGFESTLDEHFWFLSMEWSDDVSEALKEIGASLRLRDPSVAFHEPSEGRGDEPTFRLRCHVAVPLTEGRIQGKNGLDLDEPLRPDEVRKAFNSPFWPKVLVTTSIGQEGLDLHPWCSALVHWDLASGPVALEQREGRITRFAGLAVRRAIAFKLQSQLHAVVDRSSPWVRLRKLADDQLADEAGLAPWWVMDGASCTSYVYSACGSEQRQRYEALNHERALYRLVLGVPDQDDLMNVLKIHFRERNDRQIRDACLDLCAYNLAAPFAQDDESK